MILCEMRELSCNRMRESNDGREIRSLMSNGYHVFVDSCCFLGPQQRKKDFDFGKGENMGGKEARRKQDRKDSFTLAKVFRL